ncbi:hypothetical protein Y032_0239g3330 [Ancylostoma ceylanicum]|uniref:Uncharacterized protein n=1 Tax=Ancylostoma ceylanicum TaxID=53326 RepID=A0A016SEC1_9BILA|nr:hypothetical protein Y032_0239g3330 [Ancylostoma ceylanicum]
MDLSIMVLEAEEIVVEAPFHNSLSPECSAASLCNAARLGERSSIHWLRRDVYCRSGEKGPTQKAPTQQVVGWRRLYDHIFGKQLVRIKASLTKTTVLTTRIRGFG